ncbi:MAG TPA: hypothetical protein VF516_28650 [Kofleriaceae bacterium]
MTARSFAFRPRYRALAWSSIGVGGAVAAVAAALGPVTVPLITGALGIALGAAYLRSPTWRIAVTIDDSGLRVGSPNKQRFQLAWDEVIRVVASPSTRSCFVDGGSPERSLLVPGDGAPAPYDIADRAALFEAILAHVPADKVQTVATLDQADPAPARR